jgi:DNA-binding winged helix-turn-helix (wHTH) protein/TolB-like protein
MSTCSQYLYEFGPYLLDTAEKLLLRNGEPVRLTPKAFETLLALIERRGHLVKKDELMKVVWADAFVEESNLTNNVYALRKMLGQGENGKSYIETVPKRGYRFTAPVKELPPETLVVEKRTLTRVVTEETIADDSSPNPMISAGEAPAAARAPAQSGRRSKWAWVLTAVLLAVLSVGGFFIYRSLTAAPALQIQSIAVLPFVNESGNPDLEYISDGITDTLINSLSKLPNLTVKARGSVFRFKGRTVEPQQVAAALSVHAVLQGRVVQRGDDLTLYLSLVDGHNGDQLWGEQYTRKFSDLQALQSEIARDVSHKLRARLSGDDERRVSQAHTANAEAYQLFLKARFLFEKYQPQDLRKSLAYSQQAVALDPKFAAAWAYVAGGHLFLAGSPDFPPRESMLKAKEYALEAIALDDQLSNAHEVYGAILLRYDHDFVATEREFKRAIELDPSNASAYESYGGLLTILGRHEESLAAVRHAAEINPLSPGISTSTGFALTMARRYGEAIAQLKKAIELDAYFRLAHGGLALAYQMQGNYAESVEERAKFAELTGDEEGARFMRESFAAGGWQRYLHEMTRNRRAPQVPPQIKVAMYAELGENDKALETLNRMSEERASPLLWIKVDPRLDSLRSDSRFQDLLRRVGLTT